MASFLVLIPFLLVAAAATHEPNSPAPVYWNKALPNTPMPASITGLLNPVNIKSHGRKAGPYTPVYEDDMLSGTKATMDFVRPTSAFGSTFLSPHAAGSIPFSSATLPAILARFSVVPSSPEAESIKKTIGQCEKAPLKGERKLCATSLESMVEYVVSVLATRNVSATSTVMSDEDVPRQKYTVVAAGVKKLSGSSTVACHAMEYPYAVFYCHTTVGIRAYRVSAVGEDGTAVEAVAVCHDAYAGLENGYKSAKSFCHLLPPDHIVWTPKN